MVVEEAAHELINMLCITEEQEEKDDEEKDKDQEDEDEGKGLYGKMGALQTDWSKAYRSLCSASH